MLTRAGRVGVTATAATAAGVITAGAAGLSVAAGRNRRGACLWAASNLFDVLDGALARTNGSVRSGPFDDRVADRASDGMFASGIVARELIAGRRGAAFAAAAAGISAGWPAYVNAAAHQTFRGGGGRAERNVLWFLCALMPQRTAALCALNAGYSVVTACRRWVYARNNLNNPPR